MAPRARPVRDFVDAVFFRRAGLTSAEVTGLNARYAAMKKVK